VNFGLVMLREAIYERFEKEILGRGDSENWHKRARQVLDVGGRSGAGLFLIERLLADKGERFEDPRLEVEMGGVRFGNPTIVGAGWSKNGRTVPGLYELGFSSIVVGTVVPRPQEGNEKPRQWSVAPGVGFNRMGFNSQGMEAVAGNLKRCNNGGFPVGVSVGRNKDVSNGRALEDHARVVERLFPYVNYVELNLSSPNTPGLRELHGRQYLIDNVQAIGEVMDKLGGRKPLFVKVAPLGDIDAKELDGVIEVAMDEGLTGIVAVNTTTQLKEKYGRKGEMGGISGADKEYRRMALDTVAHIYRETRGELCVVGVGGIDSPETAVEMIRAGASAVQVVTGMRGRGPMVAGIINRGLVEYMEKEGISSVTEMVGARSIDRCFVDSRASRCK